MLRSAFFAPATFWLAFCQKIVYIFLTRGDLMDNAQNAILNRIRSAGRGKVFTPKDFRELGTRAAIDQAFSRLMRLGDLRRLGRGLYHFPRMNPRLGIPVAPDIDEIADAIGRQTGSRLVPSGAVAANRLGLSTQVPAKPVYLSDGRSRRLKIGATEFQIKHVAPRELPAGRRASAMVFQALRYLGQDAVDDQVIATLRAALSSKQRRDLLDDSRYTTDWIASVVQRIACGKVNARR